MSRAPVNNNTAEILSSGAIERLARPGRFVSIDALRGAAALAVVLFHARELLWVGISATWRAHGLQGDWQVWLGYLTAPIHFGWVGVPLFFVLSGYFTHIPNATRLAQDPNYSLRIRCFYKNRFARIYPPYLIALLFTAGVYWCLKSLGRELSGDHSLACFLANALALQGFYWPCYGYNYPLWFMSVTIHLYAAYPIVFYAVRRWGPLPVYFSGSALAVLTMLLYCRGPLRAIFPNFLSFGPIFVAYLVPWLLGVLLAEVAAKRACLPRNWHTIGLIGFIAGPLLQWSGMREAADVAFSLGMAALVQWSLENPSTGLWKSRLGKHLAWLGGISYSLYLTHVPTLAFIRALCWPEKSSNLSPFLVGSLASVLVGWAFYYFFERSASKRSCG